MVEQNLIFFRFSNQNSSNVWRANWWPKKIEEKRREVKGRVWMNERQRLTLSTEHHIRIVLVSASTDANIFHASIIEQLCRLLSNNSYWFEPCRLCVLCMRVFVRSLFAHISDEFSSFFFIHFCSFVVTSCIVVMVMLLLRWSRMKRKPH